MPTHCVFEKSKLIRVPSVSNIMPSNFKLVMDIKEQSLIAYVPYFRKSCHCGKSRKFLQVIITNFREPTYQEGGSV